MVFSRLLEYIQTKKCTTTILTHRQNDHLIIYKKNI